MSTRDITEQQGGEGDMLRGLAALIEASHDAIYAQTLEGTITKWNEGARRLYGYTREETIGRSCLMLIPADCRDELEKKHALLLRGEAVEPFETRRLHKDGQTVFVSVGLNTITDAEGRGVGIASIGRDITDRKRAEETLRREHEFSEGLVDTARTIVLVLDSEGRVVRFNSYMEELTGWRLEEVKGKDWFETFLAEHDRQRIRDLFGRALAGERTLGNMNPILTKDGRPREIEWFDAPLTLAQGEQKGLLCTGQDITDRKRAEQALRAAHHRLEAIVETAPILIVVTDRSGRVIHFNRACEELTGYRRDEVLGDTLLDRLVPAGWQSVVAARFADPYAPELREPHENPWRTRGGGERFVEWRCLPLSQPDETSAWFLVGFGLDVTERKQTEERFRLVVESAPNAVVMVDADGAIVLVNSQAEKFFGYRRDELVGQPVDILVPERFQGNHPSNRASFFAAPSIRPMGVGRDLYGRRKDGSEFPVEIGLTPIHTKDGFLVLSAVVDISERKQAEEELRRSHDGLEELVTELQAKNEEIRATTQQLWQAAKLASVGELAASIAHELNNPLATMSLRVESLLEDASEDDPNRRTLEIVQQETRRMSTLVANLLQFSRRGQEQISTVDVRLELTSTVELVYHHFKKRQIATVQELAPDTPLIYADRQKLRQVFLNLFTNASDAMLQGGILTLRSCAATLAGGKAAVRIEVADTGIGIPRDHLAKVFDPYFTTKEEGQGTGLGLAICRRIVEDHHGTIQIESEADKGSTIIIVLPVRDGTHGDRMSGGPLVTEVQGQRQRVIHAHS